MWDWGAALNLASGALMAGLGTALLFANPRKDWNRIFAILAVFWGAQILAANAVRVTTSESLARFAGQVSLAFLVPMYFFFVSFASIFPRPRPPLGTSALALSLLMIPAGVTLALLFASPDLLLAGVTQAPSGTGAHTLVWGPLLPYLVTAPFYGAVFYALFVMMRRLAEAESTIERKQISFVLAALAIYVAYNTPLEFLWFGAALVGAEAPSEAAATEATLFALIMLAGLVLLAGLALRLGRRARSAPTAPERREARAVVAAMGLSFLAALASWTLAATGVANVEGLGLVRFGSVVLIVYAIARYQLFDIDVRVKHAAAAGAALLAVLALAGVAWLAFRLVSVPASVGGILAAAAAVAAFVPLLRVSYGLADRLAPRVSREGDHLYLRKLEVYRASVEGLLRQGTAASSDDPALADLRSKLGLSERDHGVVVSLAVSHAEPRSAGPDLRPGGVVFGKYVIDSLLAEGAFGRVFLARDKLLGRSVVVKELQARWRGNPAIVQTFLREAQIAGQLQHPAIVSIFEVEQHGQDYYVVMEHLPGGALSDRLQGGASLAPAEAIRIARTVLEGLDAAHARGVIHRDVKPANVLLGARGEAKLADFGIAQLSEEDVQRTISGLTTGRFQAGTLQYMSPEQARGLPLDARSDLYAVGALLYRMIAGRHHVEIEGLDELSARNAVASAPRPPPLPAGSPALAKVLDRALERDPANRFASAREFSEALDAASGGARAPAPR